MDAAKRGANRVITKTHGKLVADYRDALSDLLLTQIAA